MRITIKIRRIDPVGQERREPYIQGYKLKVVEGMTVLEALLKITDEQDPTLSFRCSCRSAICGSCAVRINGFTKLACSAQIIPEYRKKGEILIEPIGNHEVLKDLTVDFDPFWNKLAKVRPFLMPPEGATEEIQVSREDEERIDLSQQCIMCGSCNSECNALEIDEKYLAPAALAKAWRFVGDVREQGGTKRLGKLSDDHGMWDCVRCFHCTQYCPKGVKPLRAIEKLRSSAMAAGVTDNQGAKHVESMVSSVRRFGRLDEAAMTFKTLGFLRSLGMIPFGIKMEMHGKMPHPHLFPQIEGIEELKTIYEEVEKKKGRKK